MNSMKHPRLLAPAAVVLIGTVMAVAVGIGHTWTDALVSEIVILFIAVGYFFITGSKGDIGAIYRRRTDERQRNVSMKASRLAMIVMFALCFVIGLIEVASNTNYWQEDVIGSVGGVSFFVGLTIYGVRDEDTAGTSRGLMSSDTVDDASDVDEVRPPM